MKDYMKIINADSPSMAKKLGKHITIREEWYSYKFIIMEYELIKKFSDPVLMEKLLSTGDKLLVENNTWGDRIWGVYNGVGKNLLGKMLMNIRDEFINNGKSIRQY